MILSTAPGVRYVEHENLNSYRNYPFAETADLHDSDGAELASDVFVDAFVYPVVEEPQETVARLVELRMPDGYVSLELGSGDSVSGTWSDGCVELYDSLGRHAGTMVCGPGWGREVGSGRTRTFDRLWIAPSACCPVVHAGVTGMQDETESWRTSRRNIVLTGDDVITPVLTRSDEGGELRFDAQFTADSRPIPVVNQLVLAVVGKAIFEIAQVDDGTVEVYSPDLDREDICWNAHKEDPVSVVVDACADDEGCVIPVIEVKSESIAVCPSEIGNINIVADDMVNYKNPLKISPVEGDVVSPRPQVVSGMTQEDIFAEAQKIMKRPSTVGNGIKISMPGLMNGK